MFATAATVVILALVGYAGAKADAKADGVHALAAGYGAPAHADPCPTHFITKYDNKIQKIPVRHTVFKTQLVPTEVVAPKFEKTIATVVKNQFLPRYVTTTKFVNQVVYATDYRYVTETEYQTVLVTQTQVLPTIVTQTAFNTVIKTNVDYQTKYETQVVPTYLTKQETAYNTEYKTNLVPQYSTIYKTVYNVKTVCPKKGYGY